MSTTPKNMVEMAQQSCERFADRKVMGTRSGEDWVWVTYRELGKHIDHFRGGLASLGVSPGDRVGIVSRNRVEWAVACYATYGLGGTFVPMYEHQRADEWAFILADAGARVVIAGDAHIAAELARRRSSMPTLRQVVTLDESGGALSYSSLLAVGAEHPVPAVDVEPHAVADFIYTSGTTGQPKGVMLTHANLMFNVTAVQKLITLEEGDVSLAFLPWAHSYGKSELHVFMSMGAAMALNQDATRLLEDLAEVRPTILVAVPRVFNRLFEKVQHQIAGRSALIQRLFRDGIDGALRRAHGEPLGLWRRIELGIDNRLIFSKIRHLFGGRLRIVMSAAASLSPDVAEFVDALGLPVYEAYGLTETSPIVSANAPGMRRMGSVGKPVEGIRVELDRDVVGAGEDGEIVVYGPNVMRGYHERPEENARAFTPEGGLRTGDLGHLDEDGYLYITGRIKEHYKLDNAKFVMPSPLEERLQMSPYIASVMLYGIDRPYNIALVVPELETIKELLDKEQVPPEERDQRVRALIRDELAIHSEGFKSFEIPRKFALLPRDFSIEDDTLTPSFKLKRRNVVARYRDLIEQLYLEVPPPVIEPPPPQVAAGPA